MASFEEHCISSKIDSSNAEITRNTAQNYCIDPLPNAENNNINVNFKRIPMIDKVTASSTMENVIGDNCAQNTIDMVHSNSAFTATPTTTSAASSSSAPSLAQIDCGSVAENVVSSTQETSNEIIKIVNKSGGGLADDGDVNNAANVIPQPAVKEKCLSSDSSRIASVSATSIHTKQNKISMHDPKYQLHSTELPHNKSKSSDGKNLGILSVLWTIVFWTFRDFLIY